MKVSNEHIEDLLLKYVLGEDPGPDVSEKLQELGFLGEAIRIFRKVHDLALEEILKILEED